MEGTAPAEKEVSEAHGCRQRSEKNRYRRGTRVVGFYLGNRYQDRGTFWSAAGDDGVSPRTKIKSQKPSDKGKAKTRTMEFRGQSEQRSRRARSRRILDRSMRQAHAQLALLVRGSSRRITIMRFRPANIRLINRRQTCPDRCSPCSRTTSTATANPRAPSLLLDTVTPYQTDQSSPNLPRPLLALFSNNFNSNSKPKSAIPAT